MLEISPGIKISILSKSGHSTFVLSTIVMLVTMLRSLSPLPVQHCG